MSEQTRDLFRGACGAIGKLELRLVDRDRPEEIVRRSTLRPFLIIGRDPRADLVLDHDQVSARHAYLQIIGGRPFVVDLGSRTGIRLGETPARSGWPGQGGTIRIGPFELRVGPDRIEEGGRSEDTDPTLGPLDAEGPDHTDLPRMTLSFPRKGSGRLTWQLNRTLVLVGRSTVCKVRLEGGGVSKVHCGLLRTPRGLWAVDLLGRDGIRINGRTVRFGRLGDGDDLQVGEHRIHLEPDSGPPMRVAGLPAIPGGRGGPPSPSIVPGPGLGPTARPEVGGGEVAITAELAGPLLAHLTGQFGQMQQQMFDQFQQSLMMMAQMFGNLQRDQLESVRDELDQLRRLNQDLAALQADLIVRRDAAPAAVDPNPRSIADGGPPMDAPPRSRPPSRPEGLVVDDVHARLSLRIAQLQKERHGRWQRLIDQISGRIQGYI